MNSKQIKNIVRFLGSNLFFKIILGVAVVQGLWYAFSFQPTLFDEPKHLERIFFYTHHALPFLGGNQDYSWDHLGAIIRDGSYLFYYLMSLPLRLFELFTQDTKTLVILLRILCLTLFVGGLFFFRKAFNSIKGISQSVTNVVLLFVVLTPAVAPLPGAVNYDSPVFLMFAIALWLAIRCINSKQIRPLDLSGLIILVLLMSIIKWTSIALSIPLVLYLSYLLWKRYDKRLIKEVVTAVKIAPRRLMWMAAAGLVISATLFIERPVMNTVLYGQPEADCPRVIGYNRCLKFPDYAVYAAVGKAKPVDFKPMNPVEYFLSLWTPRMINTQVSLMPWQAKQLSPALPIIQILYFTFALAGVGLFLIYFRDFMRSDINKLLLVVVVGYVILLFIYLYKLYLTYAIPAAISGRYLLPILPILFYFVAISFKAALRKHNKALLLLLVSVLLGFTQGGGIIAESLSAKEAFYWKDSATRNVNDELRSVLHLLVKE